MSRFIIRPPSPVPCTNAKLIPLSSANLFATKSQIDKIQEKVKSMVDESVEFAENGPDPIADELYEDVYSSEYPFIIE